MDFLRAVMTETELRLPRANEATIRPSKLRDYALNADHHGDGADKARVFASALGFRQEHWEDLRQQILERLPRSDVHSIEPRRRGGFTYRVTIWIDGPNGARHPVAIRWILADGEPPWLSTLWVDF